MRLSAERQFFKKLLVVRRCVPEGIVKVVAIPLRGVHKAVGIFLDIDRVEEQAFVATALVYSMGTRLVPLMPHIRKPVPRKPPLG